MNEEQRDEIEALQSIFEGDFFNVHSSPPCFMIKLADLEKQIAGVLHLKVTFTPMYPDEPPVIEFPMRQPLIPTHTVTELVEHLNRVALDNVGMAMTFTLVEEAKTWLNEHMQSGVEEHTQEDGEHGIEDGTDSALNLRNGCANTDIPKQLGGRWDFVIGLVGKPSAGKSTFFNAATTVDLAKTGAHPFTTIEPNFGKAFYSIPCPCAKFCEKMCDAEHGHNFEGRRHIPILLKDVAGLIPGAAEGKGLGNRFLNDLLDADVFIHILDISGRTNERGELTDDYQPYLDVVWLQKEIQQWIFNNVMAKWDAIRKRPSKLIDMFTGYHANKSLIHSALVNAGIDPRDLSGLPTWQEHVVERIVDEFMLLRFPTLLVMNKCDIDGSEEHIQRLSEKFPNLASVAVSAKSEVHLQKLHKSGAIHYDNGSNEVKLIENGTGSLDSITKEKVKEIQKNVLNRHGSTNVHQALNKAVSLRTPSYVFPVQCLETFKTANRCSRETRIFRDCVSLKPKTSVEEAFETLKHYPTDLLTGDFVRAETIDVSGSRRQVRKNEVIDDSNNIIRFMTTKGHH